MVSPLDINTTLGETALEQSKLQAYIAAQRKNLESALNFELFATTIPQMSRLYEVSIAAIPPDYPPPFGQFVLVCHRSFLAAAVLIGQAQSDDAAPITRRAIEAIRLAAAIKKDPAIADVWMAYDERIARWKARDDGQTPKQLHIRIPVEHPLVQELMTSWGIISDGEAHFTPEYLHSLRWQKEDGKMSLDYFSGDQRTIETEIVHLLGAHVMMLRVLDYCFDGAFTTNPEWTNVRDDIKAAAQPYADKILSRYDDT